MWANKRVALLLAMGLLLPRIAFAAGYTTRMAETGVFQKKGVWNGSVMYLQSETVVSRESGVLQSVEVSPGQTVSAGDVLATYLSVMSDSDIRQAQVDLEQARDDYEYEIRLRQEKIAEFRAAAEQAEDPLKARENELLAQREELTLARYEKEASALVEQKRLACEAAVNSVLPRSVRCSMNGYVYSAANSAPGTKLEPGRTLAGIVAPETALIRVDNAAGELRYGMEVEVQLTSRSGKTAAKGVVVSADHVLPGQMRTGSAFIACEAASADAYSAASVTAETMRLENVLIADANAVFSSGGHRYVQIVDKEGNLHTRYVSCALETSGGIWITGGIRDGDRLMTK